MMLDREQKALMSLLRAGLWEREDAQMGILFPLSDESWEEVFRIACRQTVIGLTFKGLEWLPEDASPPMHIAARWMAYTDRIESFNRKVGRQVKLLYDHFAAGGVKAVLQKGLGVAAMYPEPLLRESGDIDLYFPECDCTCSPFKGLAGSEITRQPDGSLLCTVGGIVVEQHRHLLDIHAPGAKRYVRTLIEEKGYETVRVGDGTEVLVPAPEVNLLLLSSHILKHVLGVGIGLRQICDMAVAIRHYAGTVDEDEMKEIYGKAGIGRWSALLREFIDIHLYSSGSSSEAKKSDILLDIIMKGGNFGVYSEKRSGASQNVIRRKMHTFGAFVGNMRFAFKYAPGEWLWTIAGLAGGQGR